MLNALRAVPLAVLSLLTYATWRTEQKTFKRDAKRGDVVVADRSDQETHVFYASADKTIAWESRIRCLPAGTDPREPRR